MAAIATLLRPGNQHNKTATGAVASGSVLLTPEGNVAVFQGLKPAVSGDQLRYDNSDVYSVTKGAIAFSDGDWAYFDGTDVQKTGLVRIGRVVGDAASGAATVAIRLLRTADAARFTSLVASAAISNTVAETAFDQSVTIPANVLKIGDRLRIRAQGIVTAQNSTDTLNVKLKIGSVVLLVTGAVDPATNDIFYVDFDVVIRTIGALGTVIGAGLVALGVEGTVTGKPAKLASTVVDTTVANLIAVTGTWSVANAGNSVRLDLLAVELFKN